MLAIVVREFGGPEVLRLEDVPEPVAGYGDVLVDVVAAGVNPVDVQNHQDGSWAGIELPYTPGSDLSGVVREVGSGVHDVRAGDAVMGMVDFLAVRHGSYAERLVLPAAWVAPKPATLSFAEAAALPLAAATAYEAVVTRLAVTAGEIVVIVGAAGGVGGFATQLAVGQGARVVAVARSRHRDYVGGLGAAPVVDPADGDLTEQLRDAVGEVDAVLDLVGGSTVADCAALVRPFGRLATVASLAGDLDPAIDRNLTIHGVLVRPDGERLRRLAALAGSGRLSVRIRDEYPLDRADEGHRSVLRGTAPGKTVIRVRRDPDGEVGGG